MRQKCDFDELIDRLRYYCYPNYLVPKEVYLNRRNQEALQLAALEFITNVRARYAHDIYHWSDHIDLWNAYKETAPLEEENDKIN